MSTWDYIVQKPAVRYLKRLPQKDQERIIKALDALVTDRENADFKPLKGRPEWRLRVGSYRVLMRVNWDKKVFVVTEIGPRGDVYKSQG